jgi:O-antigen/teichoic acid export membrane protein
LLWLQGNVFFLALPAFVNLQASAVYRALTTLSMPAYMTTAAICAAMLPEAVRFYSGSGRPGLARWLLRGLMAGTVAYCVVLSVFGQEAAHLAFAGHYDSYMSVALLAVAGSGAVLYAAAVAMETQLRARQMVSTILAARMLSTIFLLVAGLILIQSYQVLGAAIALSLTWAFTVATYFVLDFRRRAVNGRVMALSPGK